MPATERLSLTGVRVVVHMRANVRTKAPQLRALSRLASPLVKGEYSEWAECVASAQPDTEASYLG